MLVFTFTAYRVSSALYITHVIYDNQYWYFYFYNWTIFSWLLDLILSHQMLFTASKNMHHSQRYNTFKNQLRHHNKPLYYYHYNNSTYNQCLSLNIIHNINIMYTLYIWTIIYNNIYIGNLISYVIASRGPKVAMWLVAALESMIR